MDLKLYELTDEMKKILEDDWSEETENALALVSSSIEKKAGNIINYCEELSSFVDLCKSEETRISAKRKAAENKIKKLKEYVKMCMESGDIEKLPIGTKTISIQKNNPAVSVLNEDMIPARFWLIIPETKQLDKKAILAEAKKGEEIDGVEITQTTSIRVR